MTSRARAQRAHPSLANDGSCASSPARRPAAVGRIRSHMRNHQLNQAARITARVSSIPDAEMGFTIQPAASQPAASMNLLPRL